MAVAITMRELLLAYGSPALHDAKRGPRRNFPGASFIGMAENCAGMIKQHSVLRTCGSARGILMTRTSISARARAGVRWPARNDPPRIAGRHHTSGSACGFATTHTHASARGFLTTHTSGSARGFATTLNPGSAHVVRSTRTDHRRVTRIAMSISLRCE